MLGRWTLIVLFVLTGALLQDSGEYRGSPEEVVRRYCDFDLRTGRISTANFAKLPPLVSWEEEPGWDTVTVVSGYKILSAKQYQDRATVTVKWDVLGRSEAENVTKDNKSEVIDYQLRLVKGLWKIEAPVIPPHVSLPALRAFVLSQFRGDPKHQALWIGNLDALDMAVMARQNRKSPQFSDYPAGPLFTGRPAVPILATKLQRMHRSQFRFGAREQANFAGQYKIVEWGCGSPCRTFAVADLKTGAVYDPPFDSVGPDLSQPGGAGSDWGLEYQPHSRLLIAKGCPEEPCGTYYYEWTNEKFTLVRVVPNQPPEENEKHNALNKPPH